MTADRTRLLVVLLRLAGGVTCAAFLAMFLPADWMAATHRWLGMGEFPRAPVVDYLARSIALLYGSSGVLTLIVSRDVVRYRPIVHFIAVMSVVYGVVIVAIDFYAGMPHWWTLTEGPPVSAFGAAILFLNRELPRGG